MDKITILALHLGVGGVENSIISLSNMLCDKYLVEIISTYELDNSPAFEVDERVKIRYLLPNRLIPNRLEFKAALKKKNLISLLKEGVKAIKVLFYKKTKMIHAIKNLDSDIVISTRIYHNKLLGKYGKNIKIKIAQEHNHHNNNQKYIKQVINSVKNIDYLMPVSKELTAFYAEKLKGKNTKCLYIPHCIDMFPEKVSSLTSKNIVAIGRLAKEKGYLDLIRIFQSFHKQQPDWKLNICGAGQEYENIKQKILEYHLEDDVKLLGNKNKAELNEILLDSSIYIMTSYTESFGLVLIDAESYGIPLLAFDSAKGATEIIEDGKNGFLITDRNQEKMVECLEKLATDENLRKVMGDAGREKSVLYRKDHISQIWFDFLDSI